MSNFLSVIVRNRFRMHMSLNWIERTPHSYGTEYRALNSERMHCWHTWYVRLFPSTYYPNDYNSKLLYIQKLFRIVNKQTGDRECKRFSMGNTSKKTVQSNWYRYSSCWTFAFNLERIWINKIVKAKAKQTIEIVRNHLFKAVLNV